MLVTVEEAAKLLCHKRFGTSVDNDSSKCEGPICMAWRWGEWKQRPKYQTSNVPAKPTRGYCGLAGKL
jgi:hypothetical protein